MRLTLRDISKIFNGVNAKEKKEVKEIGADKREKIQKRLAEIKKQRQGS